MGKLKIKYYRINAVLLLGMIMLLGCDRDSNHPGHSYWPDMVESRAYETYSENPNFADGISARIPVKGSIPREMIPFSFEKSDEDRASAGLTLVSPYKITARELILGGELFQRQCQICHGIKGDGKGFLYTSGKYPYPPASLISKKIQDAPKGEIFHVISVGWGVMGAHGPQLTVMERWQITEYVKSLTKK